MWLPAGSWPLLLDFLSQRFPGIDRDTWRLRMQQGKVSDAFGHALSETTPYTAGCHLHYYRELPRETLIPHGARILYRDDHLLVADKPHFLPTMPAGRFLQQSLLVWLRLETGLQQLAPLHRLDRETAGLVLFSVDADTRAAYSELFATRRILKVYEALAPSRQGIEFPLLRRSRIVRGEPFFRMREIEGPANADTAIDRVEGLGDISRYRLQPGSGKKHQLRVHMAALGLPILNDRWYPQLLESDDDDIARPLKLLARRLAFIDPVSGQAREFESLQSL